MKFIKKMTDRYNIITLILVILLGALIIRLSALTIAKGDYYRDISDNRRLKEVSITAARGEIRDRNGKALAINKPSFTVQILKDELVKKDEEKKNELLLTLIRLLEEDGASYIDEFPIDLNVFNYENKEKIKLDEMLPIDRVIETIREENLLREILLSKYEHEEYENHYRFINGERALNAVSKKIPDIPIIINDEFELEYDENVDLNEWNKSNDISGKLNPIDLLIKLIDDDKAIIRRIIDHPISRKLVYDILVSKGLDGNLVLLEYSLIYDEDYINQKRSLMNLYPEVNQNTSAKEDFVNIFKKSSLRNLLERTIVKTNRKGKEETILPGEILIDMINEKNKDFSVTVEANEENSSAIYNYTGNENLGGKSVIDYLIEEAENMDILESFIKDSTIRPLAQEQMIIDGINTRISISDDFEYVAINNKLRWYSENKIDENSNSEEAFETLKKKYNIPESLSKYESQGILYLYEKLAKQGHMAYQPINIAYDIKNKTVAKIEEGMSGFPGIQVSIEPVREYPEKNTAAHILGYLGKISSPGEIEKYVGEKEYSPNDIIGKTGIEESYEDLLRGENGVRRVEVDAIGNTTKVISEEKPVPGNNVYLTIDLDLQKVAEESLKKTLDKISTGGTYESKWGNYRMGINRSKNQPYKNATSGATVAIDVKTMEVLAMASYPAYDPNLFATGISNTDWLSLFPENEKDLLAPRPLYNVATQTAVQPGSVYKMITALTGLEKGLSPTKQIRDMGYVEMGKDNNPACWLWNQSRSTHGYENVYEALRDSCNYYCYSLALGKNQRTGEELGIKVEIEDIIDMSKKFGLNDKTGIEINIPNETSGGVPEPHKKIQATKNRLRNYLKKEIKNYMDKESNLNDEEIGNLIEEIVSWLDLDEVMTRGEVIEALSEFEIDPEKINALADRIKYDYLNQAGWSMSDTLNITIGQGESSYTAIQMANFLAMMVNGGYKRSLNLVDNVKNYNNSKVIDESKEEFKRIELNNYTNLEAIKKGMQLVSSEGTSSSIFADFPVMTGTKTGTAENTGTNPVTGESYDNFAWFVGFGPYEDPEIAVATIIFQGGSGGYAAPMTRDIIAQHLGLNDNEESEEE